MGEDKLGVLSVGSTASVDSGEDRLHLVSCCRVSSDLENCVWGKGEWKSSMDTLPGFLAYWRVGFLTFLEVLILSIFFSFHKFL